MLVNLTLECLPKIGVLCCRKLLAQKVGRPGDSYSAVVLEVRVLSNFACHVSMRGICS